MADAESGTPSPSPRRFFSWPVLLVLVLLALALFGDRGVLRAIQANRHKEALAEQARRMEEANHNLRLEIDRLRSDSKYLENIARRELGMVRDDERVYQFRTTDQPSDPPPSQPDR